MGKSGHRCAFGKTAVMTVAFVTTDDLTIGYFRRDRYDIH